MNALTSLPRRTFEELRDFRSDEQRLQDAVEAHLVNVDRLNSVSAGPASERLFGEAQAAFDDSQAELFRLVEDMLCIDPRKLARALAS